MDELGLPFSGADIPGHLSYVLIAISYWLTSFLWLRITAVIGLALEIVYFRMSGGAMHAGIGWDVVFILINLYQIYRLVEEHRRLRHQHELHLLSQGAFAGLTRAQVARLARVGSWRAIEVGETITREGEPVAELVLICSGQVEVESQGRAIARLHAGSLVGELAFVSGNPASATVTVEAPVRAFVLDMEGLRRAADNDEVIASTIDRVIGRDLAAKLGAETRLRAGA